MITEADTGRYSAEAIILAARLAQEPWLSAQTELSPIGRNWPARLPWQRLLLV